MFDKSTTTARQIVIRRLNALTASQRVTLSAPISLDPATMAAIQTGRIPTSNPGGASHA